MNLCCFQFKVFQKKLICVFPLNVQMFSKMLREFGFKSLGGESIKSIPLHQLFVIFLLTTLQGLIFD